MEIWRQARTYLTADVSFDPPHSSVPARDRRREWQKIRWQPVRLCAQLSDRPVIKEACLIFHARESSVSKAFPEKPPLSPTTTPD